MRIVVVGGGIGGLALGLLLPPRGHEVTLLEGDPMEAPADAGQAWACWPRRGVAQLRQIHLFNARGRAVLSDRAPAVLEAVRAAGAGEIRVGGWCQSPLSAADRPSGSNTAEQGPWSG